MVRGAAGAPETLAEPLALAWRIGPVCLDCLSTLKENFVRWFIISSPKYEAKSFPYHHSNIV